VLSWMAIRADGLLNILQLDPERPWRFVGMRGLLSKISPACAYFPITCITIMVVVLLWLGGMIATFLSNRSR